MDFCWTEYMKTEEQNWKENHGIQNTGTEDSKGKLIVDKRQVLIIWETYLYMLKVVNNTYIVEPVT